MYDLILYDTSNFVDFPIGGQLTSVRNFLKYISTCRPEYAEKVLLVGVCTKPEEAGTLCRVAVGSCCFDFLPVLYRDPDLSHVHSSLRLEYVKGLFKRNRRICCSSSAVHYMHTPEAYIAVKLLRPMAETAVFSHGSFFNMVYNFRFFQKNRLVRWLFTQFLVVLLKTAGMVFTLDEESRQQYLKYTNHVFLAENSIVLPEGVPDRTACREPVRLLFVGRLSAVKQIGRILEAVELLQGKASLTIVGDGEARRDLEQQIRERRLEGSVKMAGACRPEQMRQYYLDSDILVLNSSAEGKPMVLLEAMSYGLPVVTTPVGGIPELVRDGVEGRYTDGTARQIAGEVEAHCSDYAAYAGRALDRAGCYDYRLVNAGIFEIISRG